VSAGEDLVSKSSQQMETSVGRRAGVPTVHRRPGDDVITRDVIRGDSGYFQRGRRDASQLSDVTGSPAAVETSALNDCLTTSLMTDYTQCDI